MIFPEKHNITLQNYKKNIGTTQNGWHIVGIKDGRQIKYIVKCEKCGKQRVFAKSDVLKEQCSHQKRGVTIGAAALAITKKYHKTIRNYQSKVGTAVNDFFIYDMYKYKSYMYKAICKKCGRYIKCRCADLLKGGFAHKHKKRYYAKLSPMTKAYLNAIRENKKTNDEYFQSVSEYTLFASKPENIEFVTQARMDGMADEYQDFIDII